MARVGPILRRLAPPARVVVALAGTILLVVGCVEEGDAGATGSEAAGEADANGSSPVDDALEDLVGSMGDPDGLEKLGSRLDEVLNVRLLVLEICGDDETCFVKHQRRAVPPENVRALLEEYLERVLEVRQEVARVAAEVPDEGAVAAVEAAAQWHEAAVLAARTAMAAVECLEAMESEQLSMWTQRCRYQRDLYAAAVVDQNRLRQEFERAYVAFVEQAATSPPA